MYSLSDFEFLPTEPESTGPPPAACDCTQKRALSDTDSSVVARARAYLAKVPPAIEGNNGDAHTLSTACKIARGFDLPRETAIELLMEWNPSCQPPWTRAEIQEKVDNAIKYGKEPIGHLRDTPFSPNPAPHAGKQPQYPADGQTETIILDPADPLPSARRFVEIFHTEESVIKLRHQGGIFYRHEDSAYREVDEGSVRAQLYNWLEAAQAWQVKKDAEKKPELVPFKPTIPKVANVLDALRAVCNLPTSFAAPCWLENDPGLDPFEILACRSGLLHVPTRRLLTPTPNFFTLNALEFTYDPRAPRPTNWLAFLQKLWAEDEESIGTLQEFFGYLLTPKTHLQKILLLIGPKRAGKGTIGRVIRKLLGERNICTPTLASMNETFGLSVLIGKTAAIIADARLSGRTDTAVITERLLSISGEDPQTIPRKFLPDWNGMLSSRFVVMTNELPRIEDASGTLASRFIILALTESFYGREDHGLLARLIPELPGILHWALDGWDRLHRRGRFIQPQSSAELISQFEDLGSPIGAFVRDRCEISPGHQVQQEDLFAAWKSWCSETGRDHPGTIQIFGRNLHSFVPWLKVTRPRVMGIQIRYFVGIRLKGGS